MGNLTAIFIALFASAIALQLCSVHATLSNDTVFYWSAGGGHYTGPNSCDLVVKNKTAGSGIKSKASYMYGSVSMNIKLPKDNTAGLVATFYLSSTGDKHDEIDFELLGNITGEPYTVHTNVFTQGNGKCEQQFKAWYDPTDGFHTYTILWTAYEIVWLIDGKPIRVFKNYHDTEINFPDNQPMQAYASYWNADDWATQGGRVKTDWSLGPFTTNLENYITDACYCYDESNFPSCVKKCSTKTPENWWTKDKYKQLTSKQEQEMKTIRDNYLIYNYCTDTVRNNGTTPKECLKEQS